MAANPDHAPDRTTGQHTPDSTVLAELRAIRESLDALAAEVRELVPGPPTGAAVEPAPRLDEWLGKAPGLTGGLPIDQYLDRLRDE